ncbi:NUDIX domain-containing protein [Mucilaginibacter antarcticus]|uniref:NUDIX domain-containing protein n=1 Tax=Mucilaginibacter antarcticus TaxID=1855725 RepID=UPI0036438BEC
MDAAKRELLEETGLTANHWTEIQRMHLSNSVTDELCIIYIATGLEQLEAHPEDTEQLIVKKLPFNEVYQMVCAGRIKDAVTVAAILRVKLMLMENSLSL